MLAQRACRSAQGVRSRILVSFVIVLALFSTAGGAQAFPFASESRDSSSSCGDDADVVSVERMDRAALEQASTVMKKVIGESAAFSSDADFELVGGSTRTYVTGDSVMSVAGYVEGRSVLLSVIESAGSDDVAGVSLVEVSESTENGDATVTDLLAGSPSADEEQFAGYYAETCASYDGDCLRKLLESGCSAGTCAFLFWNNWALGTCLAAYCYVGTQYCCTRWVQSWHEY